MGLLQLRDSRLLTREARTGAEAQIIEKKRAAYRLVAFHVCHSLLSYPPRTTCPGVPLPTADRAASPHQLSIKKMLHG